MTTRFFHLACLTAATLAPTVVHAQGEHASSPAEFARMADRLTPGRWVYVGLPGHDAEEGRGLDEATLNKVHMPRGFYDAVKTKLKLGTNVLITQSSIGASSPASRMRRERSPQELPMPNGAYRHLSEKQSFHDQHIEA